MTPAFRDSALQVELGFRVCMALTGEGWHELIERMLDYPCWATDLMASTRWVAPR